MKITRKQIRRIIKEEKSRLVREMNPDGTISNNEDNERDILMAEVEEMTEEMIIHIQREADRIGGGFRSPGIRAQALKVVADIIYSER